MAENISKGVLVAFFVIACGAPEQHYKLVKLPSGRQVRVLSVGRIQFTQSGRALMLRYQTALDLENRSALEAEADDIWQSFQRDVDSAHLDNAIVSATTKPESGFITRSRSYNFVYQKFDKGWRRLPNK